jgi:hypothetical protein
LSGFRAPKRRGGSKGSKKSSTAKKKGDDSAHSATIGTIALAPVRISPDSTAFNNTTVGMNDLYTDVDNKVHEKLEVMQTTTQTLIVSTTGFKRIWLEKLFQCHHCSHGCSYELPYLTLYHGS